MPYFSSTPSPPLAAPIFPEPFFGPGFRHKRESNSDAEAEAEPDPDIRFRINPDSHLTPDKQRQLIEALLKQEAERAAHTQHQVSERQITPSVLGGALLSRNVPSRQDEKPSTPKTQINVGDRLLRSGRGPTFLNLNTETTNGDRQVSLEEQVQKAMLQILKEDKNLGATFNKLVQSSELKPIDPDPVHFTEADTQQALPVLGGSLLSTPPPPEVSPSVPPPPHSLGPSLAVPPPPPPVPTVTIKELPAKPGCRSFSTLTCVQVPIGEISDIFTL